MKRKKTTTVKLLKTCAKRNYTNMTKEGKAGNRESVLHITRK